MPKKINKPKKELQTIPCIIYKKYLEKSDNENTTNKNQSNAAKAVLRGKFIAIKSYLKKQEISQINKLNLHLKQLEEEQKNKTQS